VHRQEAGSKQHATRNPDPHHAIIRECAVASTSFGTELLAHRSALGTVAERASGMGGDSLFEQLMTSFGPEGTKPGYDAAAWYDPERRLAGTVFQRLDEAYARGATP
jgi:hypothetical protein